MTGELFDIYMAVQTKDYTYLFCSANTYSSPDYLEYFTFSIERYDNDDPRDRSIILKYEHNNPTKIYNKFHEYYMKAINGELDE